MSSFFEYVGQCMPQLTLGLKLTLQMTVFIDFGCGCRHGDVHVQHFQGEASELDFGYLSEPDSWDSPDGTGILHLFRYHRCVTYPDYTL